jgi:hypothetical protein
MDETYRMLGGERETELLREAERLHRGIRARGAQHEQRMRLPVIRAKVAAAAESLRSQLRNVGETVRVARGSR